MNDVILNKRATVERCIARIREEYADEATLRGSFTKQDSVILNLQRACDCFQELILSIPSDATHLYLVKPVIHAS